MCNVHLRLRFNISKKLRIEIKIITFAPEVEGAHDTLNQLHEDIIFSMGHTVATFDEANEAVDHGAKHVTHLYNALHHLNIAIQVSLVRRGRMNN